MKKNDLINLKIIDTTLMGMGVGKADGLTVFVSSAVTGDEIVAHILKVKSNCAFAKIHEIIIPSSNRILDSCSSYPKCGGCSFRHIDYNFELKIKEENVKNNLKRIGNVDPIFEPITGLADANYRNKAQYPVSRDKDGLKIGFFAGHSHRVIDCCDCSLQPKEFSDAVLKFKDFLIENNISVYDEELHKGLVRHIYFRKAVKTEEIMVCLVLNGDSLPECQVFIEKMKTVFSDNLKSVVLNINKQKTNVIMGEKCLTVYGSDYITDILCGVKVRISPLSFYQVNHDVAEMLYEKACEYVEPQEKIILDLYCGAGTIGLSMANKANKVIGVEIIPEAIEDAKFNARQNGFKNTQFICSDAAKAADRLNDDGIKPDVVIVDPPRKGCDAELIKIISQDFAPERVVYVSCDPATLARDCKLFKDYGYDTLKAATFDMFPRTGHVETVVLLSRKDFIDKKRAFFENAELLSDTFGVVPLMYGSLGLEYLTGENLNSDDIDILIPNTFLTDRWSEFCSVFEKCGYVLVDEKEHTFEKRGISYSYAQIEELESFAGISVSEIATLEAEGCCFKLLSLEQYLDVYTASSKDGYRVSVRNKKDAEKN